MSKRLSEVDDQLAKRVNVVQEPVLPLHPFAQVAQPKKSLAAICNIATMKNIHLESKDVELINKITYFAEKNCVYSNKFSITYNPDIDNGSIRIYIFNILISNKFSIIGDVAVTNNMDMFGMTVSKTATVNVSWKNQHI
jgi:diacylglycerol kinase family enzyme